MTNPRPTRDEALDGLCDGRLGVLLAEEVVLGTTGDEGHVRGEVEIGGRAEEYEAARQDCDCDDTVSTQTEQSIADALSSSFSQGCIIDNAKVVSNHSRLRQRYAPTDDWGALYGSASPKSTSDVVGTLFHVGSEYSQASGASAQLEADMACRCEVGRAGGM